MAHTSSMPPDGPDADVPEENEAQALEVQALEAQEEHEALEVREVVEEGETQEESDESAAENAPAATAETWAGESATKTRSRALIATAVGVSYLVLAAGTAAAVVAVASPAPVNFAALASPSTSGSNAASGSGSASPSASASPSPSPSPSPKSTVTGSVNNGVHHGDLRYFLLPPPNSPSSIQGNPDGNAESLSDVVTEYGGTSDTKSFLTGLGFKAGANRTYQDSTLGANVSIELIQFGSSGSASEWLQGFSLNGNGWNSFSVSGESGASAREKSTDGYDNLIGVYAEGDTFYEVTIYGMGTLPHADLSNLMTAEHSRLSHG